MDLALHTQGLRREFGTFVAVDGIDLEVPRGSLYGFVGPNGAGKSTTIKCLTGLLAPSAGTIEVLGLDPLSDPMAVKRQVGVVPEDLALFEQLTAADTLAFVGQVHGLPAATIKARSAELLTLMDLTGASGQLVADCSHGMRKKTSLAAALLPAPFDLAQLRAGNPHPLASILGLLSSVIAYGICGGIFAATLALTRSPLAGLAAAALVLAAGAGIARLGWPLAARALDSRRENLAMVAQGR
jgi:ABC-type ATPase involved in cell division